MERLLDVSMLEPCQPLEQTMAAVQQLPLGDHLRVLHRREPYPLFPLLERAGFAWHCRQGGAAGYEIFIWRADDGQAESSVRSIRGSRPIKQSC